MASDKSHFPTTCASWFLLSCNWQETQQNLQQIFLNRIQNLFKDIQDLILVPYHVLHTCNSRELHFYFRPERSLQGDLTGFREIHVHDFFTMVGTNQRQEELQGYFIHLVITQAAVTRSPRDSFPPSLLQEERTYWMGTSSHSYVIWIFVGSIKLAS